MFSPVTGFNLDRSPIRSLPPTLKTLSVVAFTLALFAISSPFQVYAGTFLPPNIQSALADGQPELVITGQVVEIETGAVAGRIMTRYQINMEQTIVSDGSQREAIEVYVAGGKLGNRIAVNSAAPQLKIGRTYLLFLKNNPVMDLFPGLVFERTENGEARSLATGKIVMAIGSDGTLSESSEPDLKNPLTHSIGNAFPIRFEGLVGAVQHFGEASAISDSFKSVDPNSKFTTRGEIKR